MRYLFCSFLLFFFTISLSAQNKQTIKGKVVDSSSEEWLPGVSVGIKEMPQYGAFTNESGDYTLPLSPGTYTLIFKLLGYNNYETKVEVVKNKTIDVNLKSESVSLNAIEISAVKRDENIKSVQMGVQSLEIETMNKIPVLFGERDILKTIQLLPGIQSAGEGNTGLYVRGGSNDQNQILLDDALVYNPAHLFGFFSTFNSDAVEGMSIYKGSMPARYGGRLSSALDVSMRDGNMKEFDITGGIGLISSKLTLEGPIQHDKSSFILSARRTYADALGALIGVKEVKDAKMYFYDLNAKMSYIISDKDKLTLTAYRGLDKFGMNDIAVFDWGNSIAALKWNHTFDSKRSSATSLTVTDYTFNLMFDLANKFKIASHITDYSFNQEFNFYPNESNSIKVGANLIYRRIAPGNIDTSESKALDVSSFAKRYYLDNALFASNNMKIGSDIEVSYGLRLSVASTLAGGNFYTYDGNHNPVDTIIAKSGSVYKTYVNLEPRLSVAYQLNGLSSVKGSYGRSVQNMHMLKVTNMESTPTDRWVTSNKYIKPEIVDQVSLGYFRNFDDNNYEFSAEIYYKDMKNQIDYKDGTANIVSVENIEPYLLFGKGRAYGIELFLKKKYGRFNGWIGYTLSKTEKKIDGINNGAWYDANQDRRHDLSVVGIYDLTKKWTLSATWTYASGSPLTLPAGKYTVDGHIIQYYKGRNLDRSQAYHRLDLGATCVLKKTKKYYSELSFSLYNAYGQKNPYMYGFRQNKEDQSVSESYMIYLFSIIPSISWNFKF